MKPLLVTGGAGSIGKAILVTENATTEFLSIDGGEIYGIAQGHGFYFVAVRGQSQKVLKLDGKLKTICYSTLPSGCGSVWCNNSKVYQEQGTWSRGLCVEDDFIHIGISDYSRKGKSKLVTLTRSGDIVRQVGLPLAFVYGVSLS